MATRLEQAFAKMDRQNFVLPNMRTQADWDEALAIGYGQTISQPTTVRLMLEWLDPQVGNKVLDVGSGSGWTTALLSELVGPNGKIYAVEKVPELVEFGRNNCMAAGVKNAEFLRSGQALGWPLGAPYDRILVSASAQKLPQSLVGQLRPGGKMVICVGHNVLELNKTKSGNIKTVIHPGFAFVPLVS